MFGGRLVNTGKVTKLLVVDGERKGRARTGNGGKETVARAAARQNLSVQHPWPVLTLKPLSEVIA